MAKRCAVYARFSTDKQSNDSAEAQIECCRQFAAERGWATPDELIFADPAVSGASRVNRPGLQAMMARIEEWDVLLVFDDSRLARNAEDFHWVLNRLEEYGRIGVDVSRGLELSNVGSQVLSVMSAEQRRTVARHTHNRLMSLARAGYSTGGAPYGYRNERVPTGGRRPDGAAETRSRLVVVPKEAEVVVRIFELYATGDGIKQIAKLLNTEGAPPPRPRANKHRPPSWAPTSIREMLRREMYRGAGTWNKTRCPKRTTTGTRIRRVRSTEDVVAMPPNEALRIVSEELWNRVQAKIAERASTARRIDDGRVVPRGVRNLHTRRHLLSGFLVCGGCGGAFHALTGSGTFGCSWHKNRGAAVCPVELRVKADELHGRVLGALADQVLAPENVAMLVAGALEEAKRDADPARDRARLRDLQTQKLNMVQALKLAPNVAELAVELKRVQEEEDTVRARVQAARARYDEERLEGVLLAQVRQLRQLLEGSPDETRAVLRLLLGDDRLRVRPDPDRGFAVEGLARLTLNTRNARAPGGTRALLEDGSGGGI